MVYRGPSNVVQISQTFDLQVCHYGLRARKRPLRDLGSLHYLLGRDLALPSSLGVFLEASEACDRAFDAQVVLLGAA